MAIVVATGVDIGRIILKKIEEKEAPSILADSMSADGMLLINSVARYTASESEMPIYGMRIPMRVL